MNYYRVFFAFLLLIGLPVYAQGKFEPSFTVAEAYLVDGLHKQALSIAFMILDSDETNTEAYVLATRSLLLRGDLAAAETVLSKGTSLVPDSDKQKLNQILLDIKQLRQSTDLQKLQWQAYELLDQNQHVEAADKFALLFALDKQAFEFAQLAIDAYMLAEEYNLALHVINRVKISIVPEKELDVFLTLKAVLNSSQSITIEPENEIIEAPQESDIPNKKQPSTKDQKTYTNTIGLQFQLIEGYRVKMGPTSQHENYDGSVEKNINIDVSPFYISITEVNQQQWDILMDENPSVHIGKNLPIHRVSFSQAREFARRLSKKEKRKYLLPTEAQWEAACKSTQNQVYSGTSDKNKLNNFANLKQNGQNHKLSETAKKSKNINQIYDMSGNVYEWVIQIDEYSPPQEMNIIKGGSWNSNASANRCAHRAFIPEGDFEIDVGFRLVTIGED